MQDYNNVETKDSTQRVLFGTLEVEGEGSYYVFLKQTRTANTWLLTDREILSTGALSVSKDNIVAILKSFSTGRLQGDGKTYLLTRLMSNIGTMMYLCANSTHMQIGFLTKGTYTQESTGAFIQFTSSTGGRTFFELQMSYEGFRLNLSAYNRGFPIKLPKLSPVLDKSSKAAVVANLGIKTASHLFRRMGDRLRWYVDKKYVLIDSKEKFQNMMLEFLTAVQQAALENKTVLVGLDTETTGLNMLDLAPDNPLRDNVVAIPFAWKDDEAYLICTDMFYFSNVEPEDVYPLFTTLFRRNVDFSFPDIDLDYCGQHFNFSRMNITVSGWNVMFDEQAFFSEGADIFFDEDGRQLYFNLNTDLQQGQKGFEEHGTYQIPNSLKSQTRRMLGDETLELNELFGKGNEDKFRYLQDPELALIYGGADADYTRKMVREGRSMTEKALYAQYRKYDMTIAYMLAKASWKGMPIDSDAVKREGDLVYKDLERLKDFIYHYAWLANRDTLKDKMKQLQDTLGIEEVSEIGEFLDESKMFRYPFTPANHKKLLFSMLKYPVKKYSKKSGEPALDKEVLQKLMNHKRETPVEVLKENIMSISDPTEVLIDKDLFNSDAYPLARVFSTYATKNKEYTSYYKPILTHDTEGRMFYSSTLARAATRRILNPGQTLKGSLKKLVVAPEGKLFMSFDASQIEYRHMASLAYIRTKKLLQQKHPNDWEERLSSTTVAGVHRLMQKEEADYHIETAASMTGVRQHEITPKVRKRYKNIGFGIPYGLGDRNMCENLHNGVVNEATMKETRELLADFKKKQKEVIDLLESTRDSAFIPANISDSHRKYLGVGDSHVGLVRNFCGFYRVFILENLTRGRVGRMRRQAGNCIIQGGAAELFRRMLYNFHIGCCKEGIVDKVQWLITVHDELDALIDDSIDIMKLIKVIYNYCTLRYDDHIPYYVGINFGPNWYAAKSDDNELPVIMVQRMIDAYDRGIFSIPSDGNQAQNLLKLKRHYMCDRIYEELKKILPNLTQDYQYTDEDIAHIDDKFENYIVRSYMDVFSSGGKSLKEKVLAWHEARKEYGFGVSFLTTRFDMSDIDFSDFDLSDMDLSIDLLSDDDDSSLKESVEGNWFNEISLFDQTMSSDEILVDNLNDSFETDYSSSNSESELIENSNPSSAFDVFIMNRYVRQKVLKVADGMYSVTVAGTEFYGKEKVLAKEVKKRFDSGSDTLIFIGASMFKLENVACTDSDLEWLDKLVLGEKEKATI